MWNFNDPNQVCFVRQLKLHYIITTVYPQVLAAQEFVGQMVDLIEPLLIQSSDK